MDLKSLIAAKLCHNLFFSIFRALSQVGLLAEAPGDDIRRRRAQVRHGAKVLRVASPGRDLGVTQELDCLGRLLADAAQIKSS